MTEPRTAAIRGERTPPPRGKNPSGHPTLLLGQQLASRRVEELYALLEEYGDDTMREAIGRAVRAGTLSVTGVTRALSAASLPVAYLKPWAPGGAMVIAVQPERRNRAPRMLASSPSRYQ